MIKKNKENMSLTALCFIIAFFVGCDGCHYGFDGHVLDKQTGLPVDSAKVDFYLKGDLMSTSMTDSLGYYISLYKGRCGKTLLKVNKNGYRETIETNIHATQIYLEK